MKRYRRCIYLYVLNMLIGALLKYIVYKIILGHIFLCNSWTECSISKVLQEIVFLHYVGEKRIVLFNKAEEMYFSVEFLRSRSISIVNLQNAMSPQLIWPQTACFSGISHKFSSVAQSCPTFCDSMDCSTPGFPVLHHLPSLIRLMSMESVMPCNHLCLLFLPSIIPRIRVFSMSQFFASGGHSIAVSASASVLPMNI